MELESYNSKIYFTFKQLNQIKRKKTNISQRCYQITINGLNTYVVKGKCFILPFWTLLQSTLSAGYEQSKTKINVLGLRAR